MDREKFSYHLYPTSWNSMPNIKVYRIVETEHGFGVVVAYDRVLNRIDVALPHEKLYNLGYDEVRVTPFILKKTK